MKKSLILFAALIISNLHHSLSAQQASYWQQHVDYEINVTLDDVQHMLNGSLAIRYTNNSPDELTFIWMHLWPNAYKDDNTAFARQKWDQGSTKFHYSSEEDKGYIDHLDFKVGGEPVQLEYDPNNPDIAKIILNKPLKHGETINIKTTFRVKIPRCFSRMGHDGQQYQISQWFPKPAVYDKHGWHPIPYLDQGEFYSEYGNFHVYITVPENYVVGASGDLQTASEIANLDKIAEETAKMDFDTKNLDFPPSSQVTKTLEYRLENAHDFAWFADKRFHVMKSSVTLPQSGRIVKTYVYFDDRHAKAWKSACDYVNRSVLFYSDKVGEYVWNVAQAVDGSLEVEGAGGMEYPTITVITGDYDSKMLDDVITHEVGHNWFYGMIGSNEREHGWMDEGINTYYENRYMDTYYTQHNPLGIPQNIAAKLGVDTSDSNNMTWNLMQTLERENRAQAINLHAKDFTAINYGVFMYMGTGYDMRYLAYVVGQEEFDRIMHEYFNTYLCKHVYPEDMQAVFENETGEKFGWFFEDMINSDRGPDYALSRFQEGKTAMAVDITNNSNIAAPYSLSLMSGDSIVHTDWYRGFTGKQTVYVNYKPEWNITALRVDAKGYIPETDRENNTIKTSGLLKRMEPLQIKPMGLGVDDPTRSTIGFSPLVAWNNNDRWMLGLGIWNATLPAPKIEYVLAPMYSFTAKTFTGQGSVGLNFYPENGIFDRIRVSEGFKRYTYDDFSAYDPIDKIHYLPQFNRYESKLEMDVRKKHMTDHLKQSFSARYLYIQEEDRLVALADDGVHLEMLTSSFSAEEIAYSLTNKTTNFPITLDARVEAGNDYSKLYAAFTTTYKYPKSKQGIDLRIFAGTFISNDNTEMRHYFTMNGASGYTDYLYDDMYLGRNAADGILSRQFSMNNGFFKIPVTNANINFSDGFLAAANLEASIPKTPLALFADLGLNGAKELEGGVNAFQYDAGLMLRLPNNIFEVYFPLAISDDLQDQFTVDSNYAEKISFMLNLNTANIFELMRKLDF